MGLDACSSPSSSSEATEYDINDVYEVLEKVDPNFSPSAISHEESIWAEASFQFSIQPKKPYVEIIEQPAPIRHRFRYKCECAGRSAGSIPGTSSNPEKKTFPSIKIVGHKGLAVVFVSCVTIDEPYRVHPHNLVGPNCVHGVCRQFIAPDTMCASFPNIGIQCTTRRNFEKVLTEKQKNTEVPTDPFNNGFQHKKRPKSIVLNAVRLCFHVFLEGEVKGKFNVALDPVVSDVVYDSKGKSLLAIHKLSHCNARVDGNQEIILLCDKVVKNNIAIRFYEESEDGTIIWEDKGIFDLTDVHRQSAISFKPPKYYNQNIEKPAKVFVQLFRPLDGATSDPYPFEYLPLPPDPLVRRKRRIVEMPSWLQNVTSTTTSLVSPAMMPINILDQTHNQFSQLNSFVHQNSALIPSVVLQHRPSTSTYQSEELLPSDDNSSLTLPLWKVLLNKDDDDEHQRTDRNSDIDYSDDSTPSYIKL